MWSPSSVSGIDRVIDRPDRDDLRVTSCSGDDINIATPRPRRRLALYLHGSRNPIRGDLPACTSLAYSGWSTYAADVPLISPSTLKKTAQKLVSS